MNILIIPAFFQTKAKPTLGSFFMDQARALNKAGHNVTVLYCDTYSVKCVNDWINYREDSAEMENGITIYRKKVFCPFKHGMEGYREAFAQKIIELYEERIEGKIKIDIIHAHCCVWAGYAAMKLSDKKGIPYVITEHATLFKLHADRISISNNKCIEEVFRRASRVICVSSEFKRLISTYRTEDDIAVIGNVVDCGLFVPNIKEHENIYRFLTVCYMDTEDQLYKKGIDILLKAWKTIVSYHNSAKLVIGGGGRAKEKVVKWCSDYNVTDNVEFTGYLTREQVAGEMAKCDCFVLPSRYETFGVVYIEAMACGKPVIAVRNGGPDDFVHDFNGILTEPEDVEGLTQAMCKMIDSRDNYEPERISNYIKEQFSDQSIAKQLEKLYSEILNR
jgi:glycosyltransferase involved in cell wall biosynthesis